MPDDTSLDLERKRAESAPASTHSFPDLAVQLAELWRQGQRPDVHQFLGAVGAVGLPVMVAVLRVDQQQRWQVGDPVRAEEYFQAYPPLHADLESAVELIYGEFLLRRQQGEAPVLEEYQQRFPAFAVRLQQQIELRQALDMSFEVPPTGPLSGHTNSLTEVAPHLQVAPGWPSFPGYELRRELGRGGMGIVYLAHDSKRQQLVALKTMQWLEPAALYRFKQEFRSLAGLSHPNLVSLHELISDGRLWFFTMEYVEGVHLLKYVRQAADPTAPVGSGPGLTAAQAARLRSAFGQLALGVMALHTAGKLHRDVKPGNVLVTRPGRVVLLDFGLAAELDRGGLHQSTEPRLLGTVAYMAPEQAACQPLSPACDWYALGVMLFEALTGRPPFEGMPLGVLLNKQLHEAPRPGTLVEGVPQDLDELCGELLQRDPSARPSGHDILRRLGGGPVQCPAAVPAGLPVGEAPLIGRQRHLQELEDAFEAARQGQTIIVCVHGHSGAGKSVLVLSFLDSLAGRAEAVVLAGRCYEQESVPYKALDSLVDALSRYLTHLPPLEAEALLPRDVLTLARVFPVLQRVNAVARSPRRGGEVSDPQELRRRALAALRELLGRLGDRKPLVLCIDDLQWGDIDSAALLSDLVRPPDAPALLLLVCYRSEDAARSPCLTAFLVPGQGSSLCSPLAPRVESPLAERVDYTKRSLDPTLGNKLSASPSAVERRELAVEPLTPEEGRQLVRTLLAPRGPVAEVHAETIAREAGGNPFFVYELVQHLQTTPDLAGAGLAREGDLSLSGVLWLRILRLPEAARRLLEVVAVAGRPLPYADACRAAGVDRDDRAILASLRSGRLVRGTGTGAANEVETYHDRIRETVVAHLTPEARRQYHHQLARVREASGGVDPEVLAIHFEGAGELERAGRYYARAADQAAAALAFDRAVKLYRLALEPPLTGAPQIREAPLAPVLGGEGSGVRGPLAPLAPAAPDEHALRVKLADALANAGRGAESARTYLAAVPAAVPAEALELQRRAALQFLCSGHVDDGLAVLRSVLAAAGMTLLASPRRTLWALIGRRLQLRLRGLGFRRRPAAEVPAAELTRLEICWTAAVGLSVVDYIQGAYFHTRGLLLALRAGEPYHLARALAMEAAHTSSGGTANRHRTARLLQAAEALAQEVNQPYVLGMAALARGLAAAMEGSWRSALQCCDQAEAIFRGSCTGVMWELGTTYRFALWPLMFMGNVTEIAGRLPRLLREARERDDLYTVTSLSLVIRTFLRLATDQPERARRELQQVMEKWSHHGFHVQHMNRLLDETQIDLYMGDAKAAWDRLAAGWPAVAASHLLRAQQVRIFLTHLRARTALAAAAGAAQPGPLLRAARRDARSLLREGVPWSEALGQLIAAGVAQSSGDRAGAVRLLRDAASRCDAADMHLYAAVARRRLGELLQGDEGRALVVGADSWMAGQKVQNPGRMAEMLAPGFGTRRE